MSRYRPPAEKSSPYITPEGYARLKAEYDQLWSVRRPEVVRALAAAAAEGDRSENAEYQYRKKELREIDRRVHYLQVRLPALKVAGARPSEPGRVFFGARVTLADAEGAERSYRIVGSDEADGSQGLISVDSPLARALIRKEEGDTVQVTLPAGESTFDVVEVAYPAVDAQSSAPG